MFASSPYAPAFGPCTSKGSGSRFQFYSITVGIALNMPQSIGAVNTSCDTRDKQEDEDKEWRQKE